jgi:hypothetical protein
MIAKLMLNNLYGRFGLKYEESISKFVTPEEAIKLILTKQVVENYPISEDLEFIRYSLEPSDILEEIDKEEFKELNQKNEKSNEDFIIRSIPIAAMITSYARCYMHQFLNIPDNICYYSDTDSIVLKYPLDSKFIGNEIGQFKFVGKIKKGYFIAPKLYCIVQEDGKVIIKSKGLDHKNLNENDFKDMLFGINKKNTY